MLGNLLSLEFGFYVGRWGGGVKTENDCGPIQRFKNSDRHVALATTFCRAAPNICVSSVWDLLPAPEDFHVDPRFLENLCTPGSI